MRTHCIEGPLIHLSVGKRAKRRGTATTAGARAEGRLLSRPVAAACGGGPRTYPDLKGEPELFSTCTKSLSAPRIDRDARRFFNGAVRNLNTVAWRGVPGPILMAGRIRVSRQAPSSEHRDRGRTAPSLLVDFKGDIPVRCAP